MKKNPMKKKAAAKKATPTKPAARRAGAKKPATKPAAKRAATYTPAPLQSTGWAPFRYPLEKS